MAFLFIIQNDIYYLLFPQLFLQIFNLIYIILISFNNKYLNSLNFKN